MNNCFIALEPERRIKEIIDEQKKEIRMMVGEQKYLSHSPHLTLITSNFNDLPCLIERLQTESEGLEKIAANIKGLHVFYDDVQTEGNTLTYGFSEQTIDELRKVQKRVIDSLERYNDKSYFERISDKFNDIERQNYQRYGFPFVGENWIPHLTLSSIEKPKFEEVYNTISKKQIGGSFKFDNLALYEITDKGNILLASFPLDKR